MCREGGVFGEVVVGVGGCGWSLWEFVFVGWFGRVVGEVEELCVFKGVFIFLGIFLVNGRWLGRKWEGG